MGGLIHVTVARFICWLWLEPALLCGDGMSGLTHMNIRKQGIVLFCILMFCYAYVHQGLGAIQNSRLDLLHAVFLHKTLRIDDYEENTNNKSIQDGHYYSDKAPGITFLAIPSFSIAVALLKVFHVPLDSTRGWLASSWITTVGSVGLITALGGVAMFVFLSQLVGQRFALISSLVIFLGSAPFPYATMLYSHAAVVGLICIALWAIADEEFWARIAPGVPANLRSGGFLTDASGEQISRRSDCQSAVQPIDNRRYARNADWESAGSPVGNRRRVRKCLRRLCHWPVSSVTKRYILAGLCCGLAISSEYTAATAAGGVLALAFLTSFRRGMLLGLGAVPALLLIPMWNWMCFGSPVEFGYHHLAETRFQEMNHGLFGISFPPKADATWLILFSPERGLFFWTPFLLMAFFCLKSLLRLAPKLMWTICVVIVVHVICISGYYLPSGGWALGPRHLASMLPFLAVPAAFGLARYSRFGSALGQCSLLLTGIATLIDAMTPDLLPNPLVNYYADCLIAGSFAHNAGSAVGLPSYLGAGLALIVMLGGYVWALLYSRRKRMPEETSAA